jgi:hypothetical protein
MWLKLEFIKVLETFGPVAGIIIFFIWRDFLREKSMAKRIIYLEDSLLDLAKKSIEAIEENTSAVRSLVRNIKER